MCRSRPATGPPAAGARTPPRTRSATPAAGPPRHARQRRPPHRAAQRPSTGSSRHPAGIPGPETHANSLTYTQTRFRAQLVTWRLPPTMIVNSWRQIAPETVHDHEIRGSARFDPTRADNALVSSLSSRRCVCDRRGHPWRRGGSSAGRGRPAGDVAGSWIIRGQATSRWRLRLDQLERQGAPALSRSQPPGMRAWAELAPDSTATPGAGPSARRTGRRG